MRRRKHKKSFLEPSPPRRLPAPPPTTTHPRMEAYWAVTPEETYGGWGMPTIPGRPRSHSLHSSFSGSWIPECETNYCMGPGFQFQPAYRQNPMWLRTPSAYGDEGKYGHLHRQRRSSNPMEFHPGATVSTLLEKEQESAEGGESEEEEESKWYVNEDEAESQSESEEKFKQSSIPEDNLSLPSSKSLKGSCSSSKSLNVKETLNQRTTADSCDSGGRKRGSKLKRREAYYKERKQGRSRSLTHIDRLDLPKMLLEKDDVDSSSDPHISKSSEQLLLVPNPDEVQIQNRHLRRKKLARSQVSSSEFFSVCFEGELGSGLEEFLPATKGVSLGDALRPLLEKKNLKLGKVDIFVDASSKTPLPSPATTETYFVAGKNLIIKAKEKEHDSKFHCRSFKEPSRKPSQRSKGKFFSSSAEDAGAAGSPTGPVDPTLEPTSPHSLGWTGGVRPASMSPSVSHEGSLKVKQTKQSNRWSGLFSNSPKDNSKMDLLVEQLNNYSKHGIPPIPTIPCEEEEEDQGKYVIEDEVRSMNDNGGWGNLSERGRQQQTAIWELVETEVVYLRTIKVITDLFLACLYNLQTTHILNEIDRDELFSNIPQIYASNRSLWLNSLYPMVQKAKSRKEPLQPSELRNGFLQFGVTCAPYIRYCLDQTKCQQYCRDKYHENELFKAYLAWCETRKECNRLRLMDILVRPMQRMTKYSLLLKAILKHTEDPQQRTDLEEMILSVEKFVKSVNGALRSRQDAEKLKGIADRIESYDAVETREEELEVLIKAHSRLDLFHPMIRCGGTRRALLFEGDLKVKDATTKLDAHCFLFTDMFLICKPVGRKGEKMKVVRPPYAVDRLLLKELSKEPSAFGLIYLNEYGTPSAVFTIHANDGKIIKEWTEHLKKAQKLYSEAKLRVNSEFPAEFAEDEEGGGVVYLNSRSPREGSSRASQFSSLLHSHSGSIEMNEANSTNISSRGVSFEQELRASSFSSDDGGNGASAEDPKGRSLEAGGIRSSPRADRRVFLSKSTTPNTLSVKVPGTLAGQSLPNLSSVSESLPPTYSIHSLVVPKGLLSPTHRGVSYPPPSPRNLIRSEALNSTRNPPLLKSRNIRSAEVTSARSLDIHVPQIKGLSLSSDEVSPPAHASVLSPPSHMNADIQLEGDSIQILHSNPQNGLDECDGNSAGGPGRRLTRSERADTKRYHTAGAIEEIKKEALRDSSIYKRLSWNYGAGGELDPEGRNMAGDALRNRRFFSSESMASVRSSSGVSSTTSLFHCVSDLETSKGESGGIILQKQTPDVSINVSEADPEPSGCQFQFEEDEIGPVPNQKRGKSPAEHNQESNPTSFFIGSSPCDSSDV